MVGYLHLPFIRSQDEDYAGSEKLVETRRNLIGEFEPCEDSIDVGRKEVNEGSNVQIVEPSAKPLNKKMDVVRKKKTLAKRTATKVKVEGEEEKKKGEKKKNWLDSKVEHLIALGGEMQPEFEKNAKKQGVSLICSRNF